MAESPTPAPQALELKRVFAASPERIFDAWTDPQQMIHWFKPSDEMTSEIELDLRIGGRYRIRMREKDGKEHVSYGEYQTIERPERLVFTWSWESGMALGTLVTISLRKVEAGTELTLRHERFQSEDIRNEHGKGWAGCLELFGRYLAA